MMRVEYRRRKLGGMHVANRGWHGSVTLGDTSEGFLDQSGIGVRPRCWRRGSRTRRPVVYSGALFVVARGRQAVVSY